MVKLQRIGLNLNIINKHKNPSLHYVCLTSAHLQQLLHLFSFLYTTLDYEALHLRKERADEDTASHALACLPLVILTKKLGNFLCHMGITG